MKGLEPPRLSAPDPKSGAATNYATSAFELGVQIYDIFLKSNRPNVAIIKLCKNYFFEILMNPNNISHCNSAFSIPEAQFSEPLSNPIEMIR